MLVCFRRELDPVRHGRILHKPLVCGSGYGVSGAPCPAVRVDDSDEVVRRGPSPMRASPGKPSRKHGATRTKTSSYDPCHGLERGAGFQ